MGTGSKDKLKEAKQRLQQPDRVDPEAIADRFTSNLNDPGVRQLADQLSQCAVALAEYIGVRVTPQVLPAIASVAAASPYTRPGATTETLKEHLLRGHALCAHVRQKVGR